MHGKEENGFVALKLDHGEDFYECLNKAIVDFNIKSGYVLMGIGMLRDFEIGFFDGEKYLAKLIFLRQKQKTISLKLIFYKI